MMEGGSVKKLRGVMEEMSKIGIGILGTGCCLPETVVTGRDLVGLIDTSEEWMEQRTGIETRRIATPRESLPVLMTIAGQRALDDAGLGVGDLSYIAVADNTTDPMHNPPTSTRTQFLMGAQNIPCFNVGAGCTGASYGAMMLAGLIRQDYHYRGQTTNALLIGGDILSNITPMDDAHRSSAVVLADGVGAMVLGVEPDPTFGIQSMENHADGSLGNKIHYGSRPYNQMVCTGPPAFGLPLSERELNPFMMDGRSIHKFIGTKCVDLVGALLEGAGLEPKDLSEVTIVPHQMNLRSIEMAVGKLESKLGVSPRQVYTEGVRKYGNNSTASILIGLDELQRTRGIEMGDFVMGIAFGAGLTWGGFLTAWNKPPYKGPIVYDTRQQRAEVDRLNGQYDEWKAGLA
ncbi:MAG: ketoacyl-ACP synthase III [archaeon]